MFDLTRLSLLLGVIIPLQSSVRPENLILNLRVLALYYINFKIEKMFDLTRLSLLLGVIIPLLSIYSSGLVAI